jgi:hypothetical protein
MASRVLFVGMPLTIVVIGALAHANLNCRSRGDLVASMQTPERVYEDIRAISIGLCVYVLAPAAVIVVGDRCNNSMNASEPD